MLIPEAFKKSTQQYLKKIYKPVPVRGSLVKRNGLYDVSHRKTPHRNFLVGSPGHVVAMTEMLYLLKIFNDFAERKGIQYSIIAGTLLGSQRSGAVIPWDDDVDVWVPDCYWDVIMRLWRDGGKARPCFVGKRGMYKSIKVEGKRVFLVKRRKFFKILLKRPRRRFVNMKISEGGLDIFDTPRAVWSGRRGRRGRRILSGMSNPRALKKKIGETYLGPVKVMTIPDSEARAILDEGYPGWKRKRHPSLKRSATATIESRRRSTLARAIQLPTHVRIVLRGGHHR